MSFSVAIIEPDTNVASSVEQTFQGFGFQTHVLGDGDVVEFVRSHTPTVILLNVELPKGSGYSFCNRLKKQQDLKRIPIILTSGAETAEAFAQHQKTPTRADAYMHKPFSVEQLLDAAWKLVPEAFPNGKPQGGNAAIGTAGAPPRKPPPRTGTTSMEGAPAQVSGEGDAVGTVPAPGNGKAAPDKEQSGMMPASPRPGGPPPLKKAAEAPGAKRPGAGPSLDELIAQSRTEAPVQPPPASAGPEAKTNFLREMLRQKEGDIARARELWSSRDREMAQLTEVLELRERELERARKAREDLLGQLTATEDKVASLRMDVELGQERAERLEREKKALADELEGATGELERNIGGLQAKIGLLEDSLRTEQAQRADENDRSATEIRDLVNDLEKARSDFGKKEADWNEADVRSRSFVAELQGRIAGLDVELQNFKNKLVDAGKDNEALKRDLSILRQEKATDDERARVLIEDLEGRIRDLSLDKDSLEAEVARTSAELQDTAGKLDDTRGRVTDLDAQVADLEGQLSEKSSELEQTHTHAQELRNELGEAQQHALELSQDKHRLEQKLADTQRELSGALERLATTTSDLDTTRNKATAHARDLEARLADLREKLVDAEGRLRDAAERESSVTAQLHDTDLRLQEKTREWDAERVNRQKDVLKRDQRIADLEGRVRELDAHVHETERQARQKEAELSHALDGARAKGDELDRDLNRARAKVQEQDGLLNDSRNKIAELVKANKAWEANHQKQTDELQVASDRIEELSRLWQEQKERTAFIEAELGEERANHAQDVQAHGAALDRSSQQAKDRIEKLSDALQKLKAELGATQSELAATRDRLTRAEDKGQKLESTLEREAREKLALQDRSGVLDNEVEAAQAKAEQLNDELARMRAALKRAQDEVLQVKKDRVAVEERLKVDEQTHVKRIDEIKMSALEATGRVKDDLERTMKERDDARAQALDIRRKAENLMRKYKELEAQLTDKTSGGEQRVARLAEELQREKEARAREHAQAKAVEERLQGQLQQATQQATQQNAGELTTLRAQLKERDDKLKQAQAEYSAMREKAKEAITKLKALDEKMKSGGGAMDPELKAKLEQLMAKYNEAVGKLKAQAELNKKIDAAYKELAEKHRKALLMLDEYRKQGVGEQTVVISPGERR